MKKQIPNFITVLNLLFGCLAVTNAFEGDLYVSAIYLIFALVCDFLDGFAARALKVSNPLGEQLDSLADMVAFGLAPGILLYKFTKELHEANPVQILTDFPELFYLAFTIPVFSAIRLAKFNIDTRQTSSFIGFPTPANASFFLFSILIYNFPDLPKIIDINFIVMPIYSNPLIMLGLGIVLSLLLIAEIPMCSLKFKNLKWKDNKQPFSFILTWASLMVLTNINAMPAIIVIYIVVSVVNNFTNKNATC